jgi:cytochrome bd-type quinol oxidase subunit 1
LVTFYFTSVKIRIPPLTKSEAAAIGTGVTCVLLFVVLEVASRPPGRSGKERGWGAGELLALLVIGFAINLAGWLVAEVGLAILGMRALWL